jgi:hypothetical protein
VDPKLGNWADPKFKRDFVERCFRIVDEYAPNFSKSVIGCVAGRRFQKKMLRSDIFCKGTMP